MNGLTMAEAKAEALMLMCGWLKAGETLTARRVSERFGVSLRTAQRWLLTVEKFQPLDPDLRAQSPSVCRAWRGGAR